MDCNTGYNPVLLQHDLQAAESKLWILQCMLLEIQCSYISQKNRKIPYNIQLYHTAQLSRGNIIWREWINTIHAKAWIHEIKTIPAVKVLVCIQTAPVQITKTNFIRLILPSDIHLLSSNSIYNIEYIYGYSMEHEDTLQGGHHHTSPYHNYFYFANHPFICPVQY